MSEPQGRLLLATQYFAPKNEIAAVRLTNIALELAELGWEIDVLTVDANPHNPLEPSTGLGVKDEDLAAVTIVTAPVPKIAKVSYLLLGLTRRLTRRHAAASAHETVHRTTTPDSSPAKAFGYAAKWMRNRVLGIINRSYVSAFTKALPAEAIYDVVLASFGPRYMVDVGCELAEALPDAAFVMDLRGPIVRRWGNESPGTRRLQRQQEAKVAQEADAVTMVAPEFIVSRELFTQPIQVITNGFERRRPSHHPVARLIDSAGETFILYYGGRLHPLQKMESLIKAVLVYSQSHPIRVHYAGYDSGAFLRQFESQGAGHLVEDHGVISRAESMALQTGADLTILLSWNHHERGLMTGKVYELIASNSPIICLIAGDHENAVLSDLFWDDPIRRVFSTVADEVTVAEILQYFHELDEIDSATLDESRGTRRYPQFAYPTIAEGLSRFLTSVVEAKRRSPDCMDLQT